MIQKYWGQPGCLCLHYIKRTNDGAPLPDSSAIFQRMKKGLCTNAYFSLTRQPLFLWRRPAFYFTLTLFTLEYVLTSFFPPSIFQARTL